MSDYEAFYTISVSYREKDRCTEILSNHIHQHHHRLMLMQIYP